MMYEPRKKINRKYPTCRCLHGYYDHDTGYDMIEGNYSCDKCTCCRYTLILNKIKDNCPRCYNPIPEGKRHERAGFFDRENCKEIG